MLRPIRCLAKSHLDTLTPLWIRYFNIRINILDMSQKRKLQKSRHEAYVREQGKKVVAYLVAALILLFVLVFVAAVLL